jgi:hypothetical protein
VIKLYKALRTKSGKWVGLNLTAPKIGYYTQDNPDLYSFYLSDFDDVEKELSEPVEIVDVLVMDKAEVPSKEILSEVSNRICGAIPYAIFQPVINFLRDLEKVME